MLHSVFLAVESWTATYTMMSSFFFLQIKVAAQPKQEEIHQEEEIVHEDNDWGK